MKGNATWIENEVQWVKWEGDNLDEVKELLGDRYKIFFPEDYEKTKTINIHNLGMLEVGSYITKTYRGIGWAYVYEIHSWKTFPRMIKEDIGSGLSR